MILGSGSSGLGEGLRMYIESRRVTKFELTPYKFKKLIKLDNIEFKIREHFIAPSPPAYYCYMVYWIESGWELAEFVWNPGREVWVRLED